MYRKRKRSIIFTLVLTLFLAACHRRKRPEWISVTTTQEPVGDGEISQD